MQELFGEFWWVFLIALAIGIIVSWWIFVANRKTKIERSGDPDAGTAGARRNQALIDAAPAAAPPSPVVPPPTPEGLAGVGAAVAAAAEPAPAAVADGDDLTMIKGLGPKLATRLRTLGVTTYAEIAGWSEADIDRIDAQLSEFQGRIRRDSWVEQAGYLARGDIEGFKGRFGAV